MASLAPTYLAGYFGSVTVDTVAQPFSNCTVPHSFGTFDATNATTGGASFPERTIESINGSFDIFIAANGTVPAFLFGLAYPMAITRKTTKGYAFNALLTAGEEVIDVKGATKINVTYMSQGAITLT